jgi:hypothetical protein
MPSIFVSYRRTDAPGHAGRLYDRLVDRFGEASVFKDLDSLEPGADFVEVIEETVARCDALVAVIGRDWLAATEAGERRLDDPQDWVRLEIANALKRKIRVVPVLVAGARMPPAAELPEDLRALARRHAVELSESAWHAQVSQLLDGLERAARSSPGAADEHDAAVESSGTEDDLALSAIASPARQRTVDDLQEARRAFAKAIEQRGFSQSAWGGYVYYQDDYPHSKPRVVLRPTRIRIERLNKSTGEYQLWQSYRLGEEDDLALSAIASPARQREVHSAHDLQEARRAFTKAIERRGFWQYGKNVYYQAGDFAGRKLRIVLKPTRIRLEKFNAKTQKYELWRSFGIVDEADLALKSIPR